MKRLLLALFLLASPLAHAAEPVPRTLIALYDSRDEAHPRTTLIHRFLEMPANHLGFVVHYADVNAPLPRLDKDVRGVLVWFNSGTEVADARAYLTWLEAATATGKKLVVLENIGIGEEGRKDPAVLDMLRRVLTRIGVRDAEHWQSLTYAAAITRTDPDMTGFEQPYGAVLPPYLDTRAVGAGARSHLAVRAQAASEDSAPVEDSDLVITSPRGGYAAAGYALHRITDDTPATAGSAASTTPKPPSFRWYINPLAFLARALDTGSTPVPDFTTVSGRRIVLARIDGDGWNNTADVPGYREKRRTAGDALVQEVLRAYPGIPFTLALTGAELTRRCYGVKTSEDVAREAFALPNVEAASHGWSHPLYWNFFAEYDKAKEEPLLERYPRPAEAGRSFFAAWLSKRRMGAAWEETPPPEQHALPPAGRYDTPPPANDTFVPRSYACEPFTLAHEVEGSADYLRTLLPPGKPLQLFHWSGDAQPFPDAIAAVRNARMWNMGGGEARYDSEGGSLTGVPPVGLEFAGERQIYAANANEESFVNPWDDTYVGMHHLPVISRLTNLPARVMPLHVYLHAHDAGRDPTLQAARGMLKQMQEDPSLLGLFGSDYAAIANGFFTARLEKTGAHTWRVQDRGTLNTLRIDRGAQWRVDFAQSTGVIGQRWLHGSLYVALDPTHASPTLVLAPHAKFGTYPSANAPYLIDSEEKINSLHLSNNSLTFQVPGLRAGASTWRWPEAGKVQVVVYHGEHIVQQSEQQVGANGIITLAWPAGDAITPLMVRAVPVSAVSMSMQDVR